MRPSSRPNKATYLPCNRHLVDSLSGQESDALLRRRARQNSSVSKVTSNTPNQGVEPAASVLSTTGLSRASLALLPLGAPLAERAKSQAQRGRRRSRPR